MSHSAITGPAPDFLKVILGSLARLRSLLPELPRDAESWEVIGDALHQADRSITMLVMEIEETADLEMLQQDRDTLIDWLRGEESWSVMPARCCALQ